MLFTIERFMVRASSRYLRRCFSKSVGTSASESQEFIAESNHNFATVPLNQKSLRIAILGAPNVGKSTLVNKLIKRPVNIYQIIFIFFFFFWLHKEDLKIISIKIFYRHNIYCVSIFLLLFFYFIFFIFLFYLVYHIYYYN